MNHVAFMYISDLSDDFPSLCIVSCFVNGLAKIKLKTAVDNVVSAFTGEY